jgi:hypothetical protein
MAIATKYIMKNKTMFCLLIVAPAPHPHALGRRMARETAFGEARFEGGVGTKWKAGTIASFLVASVPVGMEHVNAPAKVA